ncbi:DUF6879 family protein [Streptomyces hainanensis]|uniref:DUF6879 domain-containing protein n=1 Tax=Streptomyces hainanensis TaxID=402648 RepID=A0A4R4TWE9_9ACTN|nr:DUF6879 family protein [Streptomyces hainanensis]TDC79962.1 hypothetical protein E1283_01380 [Streptomyces hainanensis]
MLIGDDFSKLFRTFEHTAFRLEVRESYNAPREVESFRRFRAGEPVDLSWAETWFSMIRQATAEGRRFARVRVVSVPLSDYSRFGLWAAHHTCDAGEDIRYLPRDVAERLDLPHHDYWLFDSRKLVRMHFDEADKFQGGEIIMDTAEIVQHNHWRDVARHHAIRRDDFEAKV